MPRKFFRRWSPAPNTLKKSSRFRFLGKLLHDPHIFHLTRHSVSTAVFAGLFICFFPLPIGHLFMIAVVAIWLRCNLPIGFVLVMLSNPLTFPFIYYASYHFGSWLLRIPTEPMHFEASWEWAMTSLEKVWLPILVGNLTFGLSSGVIGYFLVQWIWRWQTIRRWQDRHQKVRGL